MARLIKKHTNQEKNKILPRILRGMKDRGSKVKVYYTGGNCVKTKLRKCDFEELSVFLLGTFLEVYNATDKNKLYKDAILEVLDMLVKECKK